MVGVCCRNCATCDTHEPWPTAVQPRGSRRAHHRHDRIPTASRPAHRGTQHSIESGCSGCALWVRPNTVKTLHGLFGYTFQALDGWPPNRHSVEALTLWGHRTRLCPSLPDALVSPLLVMPEAEYRCGGASSRRETMGLLADFVIAGDFAYQLPPRPARRRLLKSKYCSHNTRLEGLAPRDTSWVFDATDLDARGCCVPIAKP